MEITKKWSELLEKLRQLWEKEMARAGDGEPGNGVPAEQSGRKTERETAEEITREAAETDVETPEERAIREARLAAGASQTLPKEDPPVHEFRRSANEQAYSEDVKIFSK